MGYAQVLKRLLEEEADVRIVGDQGWSPLHAAADNLEIARILIAHGAEVNLQKKDLWTPLHLATSWSETVVTKFLVEDGATFDQIGSDGKTTLHLAIIDNNASLCQLMLNKGTDLKIKTREGLLCLSLAIGSNSYEVLKMLLSTGSLSASGIVWDLEDITAAYWRAIEKHSLDSLNVLVKKEGRLLDEVSNNGFTGLETCLHNLIESHKEEKMAVRLLKLGAYPFKRRQAD